MIKLIPLTIVVVLALLGIIYAPVVNRNSQYFQEVNNSASTRPTPTREPTSPSVGWKYFSSDLLGLSFFYPEDWQVLSRQMGCDSVTVGPRTVDEAPYPSIVFCPQPYQRFALDPRLYAGQDPTYSNIVTWHTDLVDSRNFLLIDIQETHDSESAYAPVVARRYVFDYKPHPNSLLVGDVNWGEFLCRNYSNGNCHKYPKDVFLKLIDQIVMTMKFSTTSMSK